MNNPPRTAEVLLESLGARAAFLEPLLGDLAEGFAVRVERHGIGAARRWYYGEAVRATPHLLADWRRSIGASDVRRLAGVVVASFFLTMTLVFFATELVAAVTDALGFAPGMAPPSHGRAALVSVWMPIGIACTVLGGYVAAWLDSRAPLVSAGALGLTWSCTAVAVGTMSRGSGTAAWYFVLVAVVLFLGPTIGGMLRLRATARTPRPAPRG